MAKQGKHRKKGEDLPRRAAKVYFAVDGKRGGYYIGSTEWPDERRREHELDGRYVIEEFLTTRGTRFDDEFSLIEFAEGMGIPLTNLSRKRYGNFKTVKPKPGRKNSKPD